jgi:hypothetical protein
MTQRSRFYDSSAGDRIYGSEAWAQVLAKILSDGVVMDFANELAVHESSPAAMSVRVNTGASFVQGYMLEVYSSQETLVIGANASGQPRIDRIVVRRSLAGRTGLLAVLPGTPDPSPTPPALTTNVAGEYEMALAQVYVVAGATAIQNAAITDERSYAQSPDLAAALDPTTGHEHGGSDSRLVPHTSLSWITATDHHAAPVAGPDDDVTIDSAGAAGTASTFARSGHGHKVTSTDAPSGADVTVDAAATPAATGALARAAHGHKVSTGAGPGADVTVDAAGAAGATGAAARVGHGHKVATYAGLALPLGVSASAGTSGRIARGDHVHTLATNTYRGPDFSWQNGWQYNSGFKVIKVGDLVFFFGSIGYGPSAATAFTLPAALRPYSEIHLPAVCYPGAQVAHVTILTTGEVIPYGAATDSVDLSGMVLSTTV